MLSVQLKPRISLVSVPGYKNQDWVSRKLKCMQVKQSGVISSSINCSPEPRLAGRCGCACDRRKQGTVHLTASPGFITGVVLRGSLGPSAEEQASHTPSPQTAENMPGKGEKRMKDLNPKQHHQIPHVSAALLEQLHCLRQV